MGPNHRRRDQGSCAPVVLVAVAFVGLLAAIASGSLAAVRSELFAEAAPVPVDELAHMRTGALAQEERSDPLGRDAVAVDLGETGRSLADLIVVPDRHIMILHRKTADAGLLADGGITLSLDGIHALPQELPARLAIGRMEHALPGPIRFDPPTR